MDSMSYDKKRLRKASLALAIIFALLLVFTVLGWGVASAWGSVTISRVQFVGEGGAIQSGLMFVPKGVDITNPAPGIINYHGRNNSSYNLVNWAIEQARRGYVVLNADLAGTLETLTTDGNSTTNLAISAYEYLASLNMITEISVTGHSMGNLSVQTIGAMEDQLPKLKSLVGVGGGFFWAMTGRDFPTHTNYCMLETSADLFVNQFLGGEAGYDNLRAIAKGKSGLGDALDVTALDEVHGDPAEGTAFQYVEVPGETHQGQLYSGEVINIMLDFIALSSAAPNPIDNGSMVFPLYLILSAICFILFILFVGSLAYTVSSLPLVYSVINVPLAASEGKSKAKWLLQVAMDLLIPIALFVPVSMWAKDKLTSIFVSSWINQVLFWLFACSLVSIVFIVIRSLRKKRERALSPLDFGTGIEGEKIVNWKRIGVAFGIALFVTFVAFTWMDIVFRTTGLNYQFFSMPGQIMRMTPERLGFAIPYILLMLPVYIVININIATSRRMKTTDNPKRDMFRDVLVNILLSAGSLTILMLIQFGGVRLLGNGMAPLSFTYWDSLAYGWSFPLMMSSAAGISTYLYKKTGNIWTGCLTSLFVVISITVLQCCSMPIVIS